MILIGKADRHTPPTTVICKNGLLQELITYLAVQRTGMGTIF